MEENQAEGVLKDRMNVCVWLGELAPFLWIRSDTPGLWFPHPQIQPTSTN